MWRQSSDKGWDGDVDLVAERERDVAGSYWKRWEDKHPGILRGKDGVYTWSEINIEYVARLFGLE